MRAHRTSATAAGVTCGHNAVTASLTTAPPRAGQVGCTPTCQAGRAPTGQDITVEHRAGHEVTSFAGEQVSPTGRQAHHPPFDVTPGAPMTALVTERGVAQLVTAGTLHALRVACDPPLGAHPNVSVER